MYCPRHAWKWLSRQSHHHKWLAPWKIWSVEEPVTLLVGTKPRTSHCRSRAGVRHGKSAWWSLTKGRERSINQTSVETYFCWQTRICNKHMFTATKVSLLRQNLCCDKIMFVATNVLSQQKCLCLSQQNICHDNNDTCGSSHQWQKICMLCFVIINSVSFNLLCVLN